MPSKPRPTYRAFYDGDVGVAWYEICPDGTPGEPVTVRTLLDICEFLNECTICGDAWIPEFYAALYKNGKANLRGSE